MSLVMDRRPVEKRGELEYKQRDVFLVDLGKENGSIQAGRRPVMILSNDIGNRFSPVVIVIALTSSLTKAKLPTHVLIKKEDSGIAKDSVAMMEQHFTIKKTDLTEFLFSVPCNYINELKVASQKSIAFLIK